MHKPPGGDGEEEAQVRHQEGRPGGGSGRAWRPPCVHTRAAIPSSLPTLRSTFDPCSGSTPLSEALVSGSGGRVGALAMRTSSHLLAAVRKREAMLLESVYSRSFCWNLASYLQGGWGGSVGPHGPQALLTYGEAASKHAVSDVYAIPF